MTGQRSNVWIYDMELKRRIYLCVAAVKTHAPGEQWCLRLKPLFCFVKTKWFRWVTWGIFLCTVTGIWYLVSLKVSTRLCFICLSILHTGHIWPYFLFYHLQPYHSSSWQESSCCPPLSIQKLPFFSLFPFFLSHSLSFSSSCKQYLL